MEFEARKKKQFQIRKFYNHFNSCLPKMAMVVQGIRGTSNEDTFEQGEVIAITAKTTGSQGRNEYVDGYVVADGTVTGKPIRLPLDDPNFLITEVIGIKGQNKEQWKEFQKRVKQNLAPNDVDAEQPTDEGTYVVMPYMERKQKKGTLKRFISLTLGRIKKNTENEDTRLGSQSTFYPQSNVDPPLMFSKPEVPTRLGPDDETETFFQPPYVAPLSRPPDQEGYKRSNSHPGTGLKNGRTYLNKGLYGETKYPQSTPNQTKSSSKNEIEVCETDKSDTSSLRDDLKTEYPDYDIPTIPSKPLRIITQAEEKPATYCEVESAQTHQEPQSLTSDEDHPYVNTIIARRDAPYVHKPSEAYDSDDSSHNYETVILKSSNHMMKT